MSRGLRIVLAALALPLAGCGGCGVSIEPQGTAPGRFSKLTAGTVDGVVQTIALDDRGGAHPELVVTRFPGSSCSAGEVVDYRIEQGSKMQGVLVPLTPGAVDGTVGLRLVDLHCHELGPRLDGAVLPVETYELIRSTQKPSFFPQILVKSGSGAFSSLDPGDASPRTLAKHAGGWVPTGGGLVWIVDGGRLVLADLEGNVQRRLGQDVTAISFGDSATAEFVFVDGGALFGLADTKADPVRLEDDACEPTPLSWGGISGVAYLSPCAERRLVLRDGATGKTTPIATDVGTFFGGGSTWLFFLRGGAPDAPSGELWAAPPGKPAFFVANDALLASVSFVGTDQAPAFQLMEGFDGTSGALTRVDASGKSTKLFDRVAGTDFDIGGDMAVLANFDGERGDLFVTGPNAPAGSGPIARGVPKDGFAFSFFADEHGLHALGVIEHAENGAGHLALHVLDVDRIVDIDDGVTEFVETGTLERPGVAYIIGDGPRAGVTFVEASF